MWDWRAYIQAWTVWFGLPVFRFCVGKYDDHQGLDGLIIGQRSGDSCDVRVGDLAHHVAGHREGVSL